MSIPIWLSDSIDHIFGTLVRDANFTIWQLVARSAVVYLLGVVLIRLGKSRLIAQATPIDFILCVMIGTLLSSSIIGRVSIVTGVVTSASLVMLHWVSSWASCRWHAVGNLLNGHATILVEDGKVNFENLRASHLSEHDLKEGLRLNGNVDDISEVKLAIKERCGQVGVVKRNHAVELHVKDGVQVIRVVH